MATIGPTLKLVYVNLRENALSDQLQNWWVDRSWVRESFLLEWACCDIQYGCHSGHHEIGLRRFQRSNSNLVGGEALGKGMYHLKMGLFRYTIWLPEQPS